MRGIWQRDVNARSDCQRQFVGRTAMGNVPACCASDSAANVPVSASSAGVTAGVSRSALGRGLCNVPACCTSDSAANVPMSSSSAGVAAGVSRSALGQGLSSQPVAQWDAAAVEAWVLSVGLPPEVAAAFGDADIDGNSLLDLTREEIREIVQDVKIRKGWVYRKTIFKALDELKEGHGPTKLAPATETVGNGRAAPEETSPVTRTARGFGLSVMESAPSLDDAVVVEGGFCTSVPVGSRVVRVNGTAVRSVDDIRTVLAKVPVGEVAKIGYSPPSTGTS